MVTPVKRRTGRFVLAGCAAHVVLGSVGACGGTASEDGSDAAIDASAQHDATVDASAPDRRDDSSVGHDASAPGDTTADANGTIDSKLDVTRDSSSAGPVLASDAEASFTDGLPNDASFDAADGRDVGNAVMDAGPVCPNAPPLRGCDGYLVYTYDNPDSGYPMDAGQPGPLQPGQTACGRDTTPIPAHLTLAESNSGALATLTLGRFTTPHGAPCLPALAWDSTCSVLRGGNASCGGGITYSERWGVEGCTLEPSGSGLHLSCGAYYGLNDHNACYLSLFTVFDFRCNPEDAGDGTDR